MKEPCLVWVGSKVKLLGKYSSFLMAIAQRVLSSLAQGLFDGACNVPMGEGSRTGFTLYASYVLKKVQ
mgnify:CR=1 FL=1